MATILERVEQAFVLPAGPPGDFRSREQLLADLERAKLPDPAPKVLAIFALGGLREFEDGHGRRESQALVSRLAERLAEASSPVAHWYRPRQDEFAVLCDAEAPSLRPLLDRAAAALREPGLPVPVTAAFGSVVVPDEASDPITALELADVRLAAAQPGRHPRDRRRHPRPGTQRDDPRGAAADGGAAAELRAIHRELAEASANARRTRRVDQLLDLAATVTVLADAARSDWTGTGKLLGMPRDPGRIPLLLKELELKLAGLAALQGPRLAALDELAELANSPVSRIRDGVIAALDEIAVALAAA